LSREFATDRSEDASSTRVAVSLGDDSGVSSNLMYGAAWPTVSFFGAHDDRPDDASPFDALPPGIASFDRGDDDIAEAGVTTARAAEYRDREQPLSTGVIGDLEPGSC
jgi:hypothetical protein